MYYQTLFFKGFESLSRSNLRSGVIFVLLRLKTDYRDKGRGHTVFRGLDWTGLDWTSKTRTCKTRTQNL